MIVIRYTGGLGNQMYQYALHTVLETIYPNTIIKADISFYNIINEQRGFEIIKYFDIDVKIATAEEINSFC